MKKKYQVLEDIGTTLVCDNDNCDYSSEKIKSEYMVNQVGRECPKCNENLLTERDYKAYKAYMRIMKFINILFFPYLFLIGGKKESECTEGSIHFHEGTTTIKKENYGGKEQ